MAVLATSNVLRMSLAVLTAAAVIAVAGCGKPEYCSDRAKLESSVKALPSAVTSGDLSKVQAQAKTIESQAKTLVSSAKSDFPSETSAMKTSVDALQSAIGALPSSPSTTQIAALATSAAGVVSSVKSFTDASNSKCS